MTFPTSLARALAPAAAVAALAAPAPAATTGELALVEQHLAASQSMTANFVQIDSKSRQLVGTMQLKRPGRIRFEYGRGANMLLVGNGKTLTFIDYDVGQKSSWAIGKSPLSVLLSGNPDLGRIARVLPSDDPRVLLVRARDGIIDHVDCTVICEEPKVGPYRLAMRARVAEILGLNIAEVSIKATTTEGLGFTGRREGIGAQAVASIRMASGS